MIINHVVNFKDMQESMVSKDSQADVFIKGFGVRV